MQARTIDLGGPLHYVEEGAGPPLVLVHGLGGSLLNWLAVMPRLAERRRVLALDLAGFGRTPPAGRSSHIESNRGLLDRFLREVVKERVTLAGNSMGGLITILEAAASPELVKELILVDPAQPRPRGVAVDPQVALRMTMSAIPLLGEWFMARRKGRLGAEGFVRETLGVCCVDMNRIPRHVFEAQVELAGERLARMPWANDAFAEALRSILGFITFPARFRETVARIGARALVVHGTEDRLVPVEASRELVRSRPDWKLVELEDTGHVPQLERPDEFVAAVETWLGPI
jgi:pimeloyl-ACP methyl ester carboxylesterase